MKNDNKAAILNVFQDYFAITNQHQLASNISPKEWMDLVYDYPEFTYYKTIGKAERELQYEYENYEAGIVVEAAAVGQDLATDTIDFEIKKLNGQQYVFSKYYVSQTVLVKYYQLIASSWENPLLDLDLIMVVLYLSFGFSLAIFSFKVTAAKNWLIALIALGVIQIIFGIATAFFSYRMTYPVLYLLLFLALSVNFVTIYTRKKGKKWSGIVLNQILWLLTGFLPVIYIYVMDFVKESSGYNNRYNERTNVLVEEFPKIDWLERNGMLLMLINLVIVVLVMFWLSSVIKKWHGIPEE